MADKSTIPQIAGRPQLPDPPATIPSPAKVQAAAAEIRKSWSPRQRRSRAELARYLLWHQVIAGLDETDAPLVPELPLRVTARHSPAR